MIIANAMTNFLHEAPSVFVLFQAVTATATAVPSCCCSLRISRRSSSIPHKLRDKPQIATIKRRSLFGFGRSGAAVDVARNVYFHFCVSPPNRGDSSPNDEDTDDFEAPSPPRDWISSLHRIQAATQIFLVSLFWIFLFFAASAWDGAKNRRHKRRRFKRK